MVPMVLRLAERLEKDVARDVRRFYEHVGAVVYPLSQVRRSHVAIGLPDFYVAHPRWGGFWHEVKRPGGTQSPGQIAFMEQMHRCGVGYVVGGLDAAVAFLKRRSLRPILDALEADARRDVMHPEIPPLDP